MDEAFAVRTIAHIENGFTSKFGVPRQSGICDSVLSRIVFVPEYRNPDALRGIDGYSHLWLLWKFSQTDRADWSPTVRPPKLGGNRRMGVFATRSPYRPNPIGLSSVRLEQIDNTCKDAPVLWVRGADLMHGTPILDIKPYLPYTDIRPDATGGFAVTPECKTEVIIPEELSGLLPEDIRLSLTEVLAQDPRPGYQKDDSRVYSFEYASFHISFTADEGHIYVTAISPVKK